MQGNLNLTPRIGEFTCIISKGVNHKEGKRLVRLHLKICFRNNKGNTLLLERGFVKSENVKDPAEAEC